MPHSPSSSPNSTSEPPIIRIRGLVTKLGSKVVHDHLDLDLRTGEVLGVVGASGAGKSVLLRSILGLIPHEAGMIEAFGKDIDSLSPAERRKVEARWGVLFQDGALFSSLTVAENIMVPLKEMLDLPRALMADIAALKIALVGLPPDTAEKYPAQLSGGMRKRAGLARAIALDPALLFLDEPTSGLDPISSASFDQLIGDLRDSLGLTVFMVTHDLDSLYAIADRVAVLVDKKMKVGTIDEMLEEDDPWIKEYFRGPRGRAAQVQAGQGQTHSEKARTEIGA
jgi:phospholipid/cholesterol/gamma-HCH transport system ATP-binding protein